MDNDDLLRTGEFVSRSWGEGARSFKSRSLVKTNPKKAKHGRTSGGSAFLLVRLGICAAAFMTVLGLKFAGKDAALAVIGDAVGSERDEYGNDESLGKLRFVELPSIIEVFAPSDKAVIPVNALGFELIGDDGGIRISVEASSEIVSPVKGRVKAAGEDPELGRFVSVTSGDDVEFTIYGLGDLLVEEGQPISQRQTLGTALGNDVTVRAWKSGRPMDIAGLFGLGES